MSAWRGGKGRARLGTWRDGGGLYRSGGEAKPAESSPHCSELTLRGREAEHNHSGDGAILQDRPRLQNLCVEGKDSGPCSLALRPPRPGPNHHLDSAGLRGPHGHNHSDSRELKVAARCQGDCGHQARGHWWVGRQRARRAITRSQPHIPPPQNNLPLPVALGHYWA